MIDSGKQIIANLLKKADIQIDGNRDFDITVHNPKLYQRVIDNGSVGLGEAYMEGWWDAKALDQFFYKLFIANLARAVKPTIKDLLFLLQNKLLNRQTKTGSLKVIKEHYDLSADLYTAFLDPYNQYTCGYFKDTKDLNKAQEQKLDLICRKLQLKKTDQVLDIGCGWGGFAKYAASHFGCSVTGITISEEQAKYAREFTKGLPVKIKVCDYRDIKGEFDKVVIVGMIEHVGHKNYPTIIKKVHSILKDDGLFLLHTIGTQDSKGTMDLWINKYIFPNSQLPTLSSLVLAIDNLLILEDLHNFSAYYDPTLMAWMKNFDQNWHRFKDQYNEKFYRMFKYYFLASAAVFRARKNQLWQIVLSKNGIKGGYSSVR